MHMQHACLGVTTHSQNEKQSITIVICMKPRFNLQCDSQDDNDYVKPPSNVVKYV